MRRPSTASSVCAIKWRASRAIGAQRVDPVSREAAKIAMAKMAKPASSRRMASPIKPPAKMVEGSVATAARTVAQPAVPPAAKSATITAEATANATAAREAATTTGGSTRATIPICRSPSLPIIRRCRPTPSALISRPRRSGSASPVGGGRPRNRQRIAGTIREMQRLDPRASPATRALRAAPPAGAQRRRRAGAGLRRNSTTSSRAEIRSTDPMPMPAGYQDAVADYFRRLSKNP